MFLTFFQMGIRRDMPLYSARVGEGEYLLGTLPQGEEAAKQRFGSLRFARVTDPELWTEVVEAAKTELQEKLKADPTAHDARLQYGNVLLFSGDFDGALVVYKEVAKVRPNQMGLWQNVGVCYQMKGDWAQAIEAVERAIGLAESIGDESALIQLEERLRQCRKSRSAAAAETSSGNGS
jgi:tetratricopeptide (TPR) repeat protein